MYIPFLVWFAENVLQQQQPEHVTFPALRHTVNEKQVEVIHVDYLG